MIRMHHGMITWKTANRWGWFLTAGTLLTTLSSPDLPPKKWSSANDTPRPILGEEGRCAGVDLRRSRLLGS